MPGVHWNINCVHWLASSPAKCPLSATQWHACFLISTNAHSVVSTGVKACSMGYLKKRKKKKKKDAARNAGGHHWLQNLRTHLFSLCALSLLLDSISWLWYCLHCWWVAVWDHFGAISNHPLDLQAMGEAQPFMVPFTGANIGIWKKQTGSAVCVFWEHWAQSFFENNNVKTLTDFWISVKIFDATELKTWVSPYKPPRFHFYQFAKRAPKVWAFTCNDKMMWLNNLDFLFFLLYYNLQGVVVTSWHLKK